MLWTLFLNASLAEQLPNPQPFVFFQGWGTLYDMDEDVQADPAGYGDPEDDTGFKIRRARIGVKGKDDRFLYRVSVGMSSGYDTVLQSNNDDIDIVDAYVGYRPLKGLWVNVGTQKVPASRDQIMSTSQLVFTERSLPGAWLVPNREVGLVADYRTREDGTRFRARGGVFNGNGSLLGDNNPGKMFAGRLEMNSGPASVYRTYGVVDSPTFGFAADLVHNTDLSVTTTAYGADFIFRYSGLALLGEYRVEQLEPANSDIVDPGVLSQTKRDGYLAQVGYSYKGYEFATRYDYFDDNKDIDNAGDVAQLLVGVTYHTREDRVRIGGGYQMRLERDATSVIENDTARLWIQIRQ
ncbi:MAG: hypothetical protein CMK59_03760 [Proteobacteria bacterium]|nr:hypothetical protein [Pseudomonadota bacterium]